MTLFEDKFKYPTIDTDKFVQTANAHIDKMYAQGKQVGNAFFLSVSVFLSQINIEQKNGGPFGAVIVEFEGGIDKNGKGIGKPKVIGIGANHVVPNNDPSAHAEMEAFRDAAKRKGNSDLKNAILYTSCECCPMCLAVANGSGIGKIAYINTRVQAEAIDFSDKLQYDMFKLPRNLQMTSVDKFDREKRNEILDKIGKHAAVVLDNRGEVFSYGYADTSKDPTGIASINAVKNAVKKYADLQKKEGNKEPIFCLPEGFTLICRDIPHPAGLITADWARILRKRDNDNPDNPALDNKIPDPLKIIHITSNYEQLPVRGTDGRTLIHQDAEITYKQPVLTDAERNVITQKFEGRIIPSEAAKVFSAWKLGTNRGEQARY